MSVRRTHWRCRRSLPRLKRGTRPKEEKNGVIIYRSFRIYLPRQPMSITFQQMAAPQTGTAAAAATALSRRGRANAFWIFLDSFLERAGHQPHRSALEAAVVIVPLSPFARSVFAHRPRDCYHSVSSAASGTSAEARRGGFRTHRTDQRSPFRNLNIFGATR